MASRRDQLFSYQLMMRRVVSAFVYRDADLAQVPFRRGTTTMFLSAMVAAALLGAVGIYGLIVKGGNSSWRDPQAIVVEKETGARYVYVDGQLHPVVNYASARLILKQQDPRVTFVSTSSMADAPRGALLGIVGAPDALPAADHLVRGAWTLCSQSEVDSSSGRTGQRSVLFLGAAPTGLGHNPAEEALLVRHPDDSVFLVWHDGRFRINDPETLLDALALGQSPVLPAAAAWINAIPQGPDVGPISIDDRGGESAVPDALIGQVLTTRRVTGEEEFYAALADGIASITAVQADILLHDPATAAAYPGETPKPLERTDLSTAQRSSVRLLPPAEGITPPAVIPTMADPRRDGSDLCLTYANGHTAPTVTIGAALPPLAPATAAVTRGPDDPVLADRVVLAPGTGVLARADPGGALAVITDLGVRYPVPAPEVAGYLGYDAASAAAMPADLVSLIPAGRALDPASARQPVPVN